MSPHRIGLPANPSFSSSPGLDLLDPRFLDALKGSHLGDAPPGYGAWLDKNISYYDPVFRGWRMRETMPLIAQNHSSLKCWDDRCVYYIYGFSNSEERSQHLREHGIPAKRDSGLSVGSIPPVVFPEPATSRLFSTEHVKHGSPTSIPRLAAPSTLPPLASMSQARDRRDGLSAYSFVPEFPAPPRGSVDSEVDPLLPPLKRSRVGHSRLESIGELRLPRDAGPCLRCKVQAKPVT